MLSTSVKATKILPVRLLNFQTAAHNSRRLVQLVWPPKLKSALMEFQFQSSCFRTLMELMFHPFINLLMPNCPLTQVLKLPMLPTLTQESSLLMFTELTREFLLPIQPTLTQELSLPIPPTLTQEFKSLTILNYGVKLQVSSSNKVSSRTPESNTTMPSFKTQASNSISNNTQLTWPMPLLPRKLTPFKITETFSQTQDSTIIFSNMLTNLDPWLLELHIWSDHLIN